VAAVAVSVVAAVLVVEEEASVDLLLGMVEDLPGRRSEVEDFLEATSGPTVPRLPDIWATVHLLDMGAALLAADQVVHLLRVACHSRTVRRVVRTECPRQ